MSEHTTEPDEIRHDGPEEQQTGTESPNASGDAQEPQDGREAKKYRLRLRDAESERDALSERLTTMQRGEVERLAAARLRKPSGLWLTGVDLPDLLGEDGQVDPAKVEAAAAVAVDEHGLEDARAALLRGNVAPREGGNPDGSFGHTGWADAFAPQNG